MKEREGGRHVVAFALHFSHNVHNNRSVMLLYLKKTYRGMAEKESQRLREYVFAPPEKAKTRFHAIHGCLMNWKCTALTKQNNQSSLNLRGILLIFSILSSALHIALATRNTQSTMA